MTTIQIQQVKELDLEKIQPLIEECSAEGFAFMKKLEDEYLSGSNRFDKHGEVLYAAYHNNQIVGICGLNLDPYEEKPTIGRVRHLYVAKEYRRLGIARQLVTQIIHEAKQHYHELTLRTYNREADKFYRSIGFSTNSDYKSVTHILPLLTGNSG